MSNPIKNILARNLKPGLLTDANGQIYPELKRLWRIAKSPAKFLPATLPQDQPLKVLIFTCPEAAEIWEYLARLRIPIDLYTSLFYEQHGYNLNLNPPETIEAGLAVDGTSDRVRMDEEVYRRLQRRYLLNEYERSRDWCVMCRGVGYVMALPAGQTLIDNGIPSRPYRLCCSHNRNSPEQRKCNKRPDIIGSIG